MADLRCSSGPNTLLVGSMVINAVAKISLEMGLKSPEVQINLNDLPANDFNTIFIALQELQGNSNNEKLKDLHHQPACYFTGVPGTYFGRLFPMKTLNFVHSSYSLHWLSQMMAGGRMVLTFAGRTIDDPRGEQSNHLWGPFAMALQDMVLEGLVEEEKFDSFNLPHYTASRTEIINLVNMEGSFTINNLEIFYVNWEAWKRQNDHSVGHGVAKAMRAVIEPLVANHFGEAIVDDVFMRYGKILTDRKSNKEYEAVVSITVSLTRKM
ncbi:hypothetical protein L1987_18286 [Smallanthus sonchifolius]|uniref:Uncharacterized protein n=1 Tax=Smallanthus sonchifolius TaxID=185202 RepID=A0ACB9J1X7_9ASTR|nr:hypothetical protein L1987_18286 [Smallanthus sonchifolius]